MAVDQKKIISWAFFVLIILVVVFVVIKNLPLIKRTLGIGNGKCKEEDTPFECIKKMGAKETKTSGAGDRWEYGIYGFYSNNRAVRLSDGMKGDYNKEEIEWDNGTTITLKEIFK